MVSTDFFVDTLSRHQFLLLFCDGQPGARQVFCALEFTGDLKSLLHSKMTYELMACNRGVYRPAAPYDCSWRDSRDRCQYRGMDAIWEAAAKHAATQA